MIRRKIDSLKRGFSKIGEFLNTPKGHRVYAIICAWIMALRLHSYDVVNREDDVSFFTLLFYFFCCYAPPSLFTALF